MCHPTSDDEIPVIVRHKRLRLSDKFSQALYETWNEIGEPSYDYEFCDGIMEYTSGITPQRGRNWSKCTKFYIPVNVRRKNH